MCTCRYRLRSAVDIADVSDEQRVWVQYGQQAENTGLSQGIAHHPRGFWAFLSSQVVCAWLCIPRINSIRNLAHAASENGKVGEVLHF